MSIDLFVEGIPYSQSKVKGDKEAPAKWTEVVKKETMNCPKVKGLCSMTVVFVLPENKYPTDLPYGPDLDNLTKRLFDALNETIFSEVKGKDSSVVQLVVSKRKQMRDEPTGARIVIVQGKEQIRIG